MRIRTCLRYPGGKFYGFKFIKPLLEIPHDEFREVFVGGGSVFLGKDLAKSNWINDKDEELINFYQTIVDDTKSEKLYTMLNKEIVDKKRYKKIQNFVAKNDIERAYKYFYLNRTSFSGIMNKPRCGYMLGSSVTPDNWVDRIKPVAEKMKNTKISCLDFRDMLLTGNANLLVYLDPPYYKASQKIYNHEFSEKDHQDLREILKNSKFKFILSYNNHEDIKDLYSWANIKDESWIYFMSENRRQDGKELIITNF